MVLPDAPEWRNYKVDYVNIARSTNSSVNIATQISTAGAGRTTRVIRRQYARRQWQQQFDHPGSESFGK
ncbi:hypothetical protein BA896_019935 [Janthinobacterium lividum]|uniref:Uncharacterized protein n=1 Tax=Janthinobacterium lividum TaxID=29581 RepID=A0A1E8PMN5_9BURK|nr:hypothetical protein BA896_019935 [Janthinobacterium lividum]